MYLPPYFEVDDRAWVVDLIERHPFGLLVTGLAFTADLPRS
jgi:predicted FMN-binding regulatory protein PaiB